jgi:ribosomal protein L12E/L44/L45/RPP1/RPP2
MIPCLSLAAENRNIMMYNSNPHNAGQKLRVKVPKDCPPGGKFKVTVPVKQPDGDADNIENGNKIPRELQDLLDDFARAYDDWCTAQSKVDASFETFKEKQGKYDIVAIEFPTNLVTKVTGDFLKQVVRRCRQNKYKRAKTAAVRQQTSPAPVVKEEPQEEPEDPMEEEEEEEEGEEEEEEEEEGEKSTGRIVDIPAMGKMFPSRTWAIGDFNVSS